MMMMFPYERVPVKNSNPHILITKKSHVSHGPPCGLLPKKIRDFFAVSDELARAG